ncbi:uncharacterized protein LOC124455135 [Xenia sp. Carnegie-2017]|uniref:uncharacterized protein LOC124455135 n=1 Tax=Xenia sp. Carnegie-2017 TaxID=2897299 RepID=UPI001F04F4C3|nr:uncharacterized protein LOC124455135 [Xenia sp. Carnegie-2017]
MVTTKRCTWGTCKSDSRYPDRLKRDAKRWIRACHRGDRFVCTKDSYICSLHFVGENGPTLDNPDPISAIQSIENRRKLTGKRKKPITRVYYPPPKRTSISKKDAAEALLSLSEREHAKRDAADGLLSLCENSTTSRDIQEDQDELLLVEKDAAVQTNLTHEHLKTYATESFVNISSIQKCMFLENVVNDSAHYTGLPGEMLKILFEFVKAKASRLIKWKGKKTAKYKQEKKSSARIHKTSTWAKLSVYEQFIFTLVRIKRFPCLKMLCDLFGVSETVGSSIFLTWVKFLEKELKLFIPFTTLKNMEGITRPKLYESNPCLRAQLIAQNPINKNLLPQVNVGHIVTT